MTHRFAIRVAFKFLALFALTGCGFDRAWKDAGDPPATGIDGRWQGTWKSEQDGHTGALLCVVRQTGPEQYAAYFNATFGGIFHFSYDAKLTGRPTGNLVHLTGSQDLGWPVGVYTYDGAASNTQFYCGYQAKDDHGFFALARPGGTAPSAPLAAGGK